MDAHAGLLELLRGVAVQFSDDRRLQLAADGVTSAELVRLTHARDDHGVRQRVVRQLKRPLSVKRAAQRAPRNLIDLYFGQVLPHAGGLAQSLTRKSAVLPRRLGPLRHLGRVVHNQQRGRLAPQPTSAVRSVTLNQRYD